MRLIDADKFILALMDASLSSVDEDTILDLVDSVPAADVAPVVHGRWSNNDIPGSMLCGCSVCGFTCGASSFFYCPHCGAKMDGER